MPQRRFPPPGALCQLDLLGCKRLRHSSCQEYRPFDIPLAQKWDAQRGPVAANPLHVTQCVFSVRQHIGDMNRLEVLACVD
jgi:hypothetical protein